MPQVKTGDIRDFYANGVAIQPGYKLTEKDDGTIEGTVQFEADRNDIANFPQVGNAHPADSRCECYARELTYGKNGKVFLSASYFGLVSSKTDPVVNYTPNTDRDAIETHPDFATMAGTSASPNNGAAFDAETEEFLGFFDSSNDLFGTRYYLRPSTMVSLSYWTRNRPTLKKRMTIVTSVKGFRKPPDVKDFLLLDTPYRQIGSHYQVTELYMGSGPDGFNPTVYPG